MSASVQEIRPAAHAGTLYPADREFLAKVVDGFLGDGAPSRDFPKAIIAPHSGYVYSGKVAGSAFASWRDCPARRVVLIGPSHSFDFPGVALPDTSVFTTPFGEIHVDTEMLAELEKFSFARRFEAAHYPEHAIEVQLPFVQRIFGDATIVPLITGRAEMRQVAAMVEALWGGPETVFVISSNLSRHQDDETRPKIDRHTARAIQEFRHGVITVDQACGYRAIRGFLNVAMRREMRCEMRALGNSGDLDEESGVTEFGAFQFFEL